MGPAVVDGVLEDIRIGLEINHPKFNQRRVASVKYLGELYNYRVIESTIIFKVDCLENIQLCFSPPPPPPIIPFLSHLGVFIERGNKKHKVMCHG